MTAAEDIIARLDATYDLVFVDYNDQLTPEGAAMIVRDDYESLFDSMSDWENESRWYGAASVLEQIVSREELHWLNSDEGSDEKYAILDEIHERDHSNFIMNLARHTPDVPLRIVAIDEDDSYSYQEIDPVECLGRLNLPATSENVRVVRAALNECSPEFSVIMAYYYGCVSVVDIMNLEAGKPVTLVNPSVFFGNPFAGSGWLTDKRLTGTVTVNRSDLRTDRDAFGYGVENIFGQVMTAEMEITQTEAK